MVDTTYTPLTLDSALDLLELVTLVPKKSPFAVRNIAIDERGLGVCTVTTTATPPTVRTWFSAAGAYVSRMERVPNETGQRVWFDRM